jgi:5-methylcytosine-specific restriction endonuclease McrA
MSLKKSIPKALREQVWINFFGKKFQHKCYVNWCKNKITVFDFECGHNIPESKGGSTTLENLRPLCSRCNKSMGNHYSIDEWQEKGGKSFGCLGCFSK